MSTRETTWPNVSTGDRHVALGNEIMRTVCGSGVHIEGTDRT